MKRLQIWGEAAVFFAFVGLFRLLGLKGASDLGGWLAGTVGPLTRVHKDARKRIKRAMPDLSDAEVEKTLRSMWDNLGRTVGELPHLEKFDPNGADGRTELIGADIVRKAVEDGQGAIFVSGHFANWELMPLAVKRFGAQCAEIYRAPNNPFVDRWLTDKRKQHIATVQIPKGPRGAKDLLSAIKAKGFIAMLVDQKMNDGIEVPFFGIPAMTPQAAAQLHLRYGMPLIPASIERRPDQHFVLHVAEPIKHVATGDRETDTKAIMTRINTFLEERIRERPHEWLWLHQRWPE